MPIEPLKTGNLFIPALPRGLPDEIVDTLMDSKSVRIERIVSDGHASPPGFWYDQDCREWVLLLAGSATLEFEDRSLDLVPGSHVDIAAHERHRIVCTSANEQTVWLAVFHAMEVR